MIGSVRLAVVCRLLAPFVGGVGQAMALRLPELSVVGYKYYYLMQCQRNLLLCPAVAAALSLFGGNIR